MIIHDKTPLTEMKCRTILDKMQGFYESMAEELGVSVESADIELSKYAALSTRCAFDKGEVDFTLAQFKDEPERIRESFMEYANTKHMKVVEKALLGILKADRPIVDEAIGPEPPPETEKN